MTVVEARVLDATHLELAEPVSAPVGHSVMVSVVVPGEIDDDRTHWLALSEAGLAAAYGDSEPDYTLSMVKEPNPEFAG